MWTVAGEGPAPDLPTGWDSHRRFIADLLSVRRPDVAVDLTGGAGAAIIREVAPFVQFTAAGQAPADLVLAEQTWSGEVQVSQDALVLVDSWRADQTCEAPVAILASGLAVVLPAGDQAWHWLLTDAFREWSAAYLRPAEATTGEVLQLREALVIQEARITALERDVLLARDRVQELLPLEVSPKAQARALSRTVPVSLRKRLRRRRPGSGSAAEQPTVDLRPLKRVSLANLLRTQVDPEYTGCSWEQYAAGGLRTGDPANPSHEKRLAASADGLPRPAGPAEQRCTLLMPGGERVTGSLAELIDRADPKLVSVDVWDTLIVRDRPADAAKLATARRMVLNPAIGGTPQGADAFEAMARRVAVEAQLAASDPAQEYELSDVLREALRQMADLPEAAAGELVAHLVEAEISDEIAWSRPRPDVESVVGWGEIVVASDFYMRADALRRVIRGVCPPWQDVPVFVSVDEGCSKRLDGGLLELIRARSGVQPAAHLHVGDNPHSDVAVQVAAGGMAVQVNRPAGFPGPGEFGRADIALCSAGLREQLAGIAVADAEYAAHERAGIMTAPLAVVHVARAIEQAYAQGLDRVHYVSREGLFSSAVHEAIEPLLRPPGVRPVMAVHLALSRRATFGASLTAPFRMSLQRMWSMYARQSVRAMLVSIGLDPEQFADDVAAAGLTLDEVVSDARRDPRIERLLADPAVEARIEVHVRTARSLLRRYVLSRTTLEQPFLMADIGWRGTIQDNLVRALGIRESIGVYLGLFPFLNAQPPGARKIAAAFDANQGEAYAFADPPGVLERPWTPDVPSTVGFEEADGQVVPQHDKEPGHVSPGIAAYQRGALAAAPVVANWMAGFGFTAAALHEQAGRWARDVWERPPEGLADIWFASDHDDSFGALNVTSFGKNAPGPQWLQGSLYDHVRRGAQESGWVAGYLAWRPVSSLIELAGR
jgi:hypothetical protein